MFKGWVTVEKFVYGGNEWTFCAMQRDVVGYFLPLLAMTSCDLVNGAHRLGKPDLVAAIMEGVDLLSRCFPPCVEKVRRFGELPTL